MRSDIMEKSAPISFTCTTFAWDADIQADREYPEFWINVIVAEGNVGKLLEHECKTPEELAEFIRDFNRDRPAALLKYFNYIEKVPVSKKSSLPLDLSDLF